MPEAEVNLGTLNGSSGDVGYQGVAESKARYIRGRGRERLKFRPGNTLAHIIF